MSIGWLKITVWNYCPYKCSYCYVDTDDQKKLSEEEIKRVLLYYFMQSWEEKKITFIWWEPIFFYKLLQESIKYCELLTKKFKKKSLYIITTSWYGITEEIGKNLKSLQVKVGVSIDGEKDTHNRNRKDKKWQGTFDKTLAGILILEKYYSKKDLWLTITADENSIQNLYKSFMYLSNITKERLNINISYVHTKIWKTENIKKYLSEVEKICREIFENIEVWKFYYYNLLGYMILHKKQKTILEETVEINLFPTWELSLDLFYYKPYDKETSGWNEMFWERFTITNFYSEKIKKEAKTNKNYQDYINSLNEVLIF